MAAPSRKREILERYRTLLETNLVPTEDLLRLLKEKKSLPDFLFEDLKLILSSTEKNKKLIASTIENADHAYTKLVEALISTGQPFWGEFLEREERKSNETTGDASEKVVIDDEMMKKCPGMDKLRPEAREKMKTFLQEQLLRAHLADTWKAQTQGKSVDVINLKRQNYEIQQKMNEAIEEEKRQIIELKDALRSEQISRQEKENEMKELRSEVTRLKSDFEHKWSSQIKMVDANNRSVFKMHDKMVMLTEWLRSLDKILNTSILQTGIETDTMEQLQNKLKRYSTAIESLRGRGIGTDKLKEELYDAIYTSRSLPISNVKNKPFQELLLHLYGGNQLRELIEICGRDALEIKQERDEKNELRIREEKIEKLQKIIVDLETEIERLKTALAEPPAKPTKTPWKPVAATVPTPREPPVRARQTLKPSSVQFGGK